MKLWVLSMSRRMMINERNCPLSLNDWIMFLSNQINNLENAPYRDVGISLPIMTLFMTIASGIISWMFATVSSKIQENSIVNIFNALAIFFVVITVLFLGYSLYFLYMLSTHIKKRKTINVLKNIRAKILRGESTDSNEIYREWSSVAGSL